MCFNRLKVEDEFRENGGLSLLFFWGHQPCKDGQVTASCLSQWWPARFIVDGVCYPTAEHWMMAGKARLFGDEVAESRIRQVASPKEAKEAGRGVRGFDLSRWDKEKFRIVVEGCIHKFEQNLALRDFLLSTGDLILAEASPVDLIWGIGFAAGDERARNPLLWRGENLLGFALMEARSKLRS